MSVSGDLELKVGWTDVGAHEEEKMEDTRTSSLSATVDLSGASPAVSFGEYH
ncbi:hypothetical protein ACFYTV_17445 [Streptomyces sp. NPDC004562]|uniref:hypothetical protein n=1 Tax=Streptomyces sp. NPDC004562 TaxID=3364703 RepID=UPI003696836F